MNVKRSEKGQKLDFSDKYIKWFSELGKEDVQIAGGKGANLGEMFNNKFPVPPGFVITSEAFSFFISDVRNKIKDTIIGIDFENTEELQEKTKQIRELIISQKIPDELKQEILEDYHILGGEEINEKAVSQDALNILKNSQEPIFVSVRSSATTEDLADASFAGQQQSFLNIKGDYELIEHVKKCFASLYTARAVYYRHKKGFSEDEALLAVVVQKMVDSEKSGVVFSKDPISLEDNVIVEAVFGLGEGIVSGKIQPDHYTIKGDNPESLDVEKVNVANKKIAIVRSSSGENKTVKLSEDKSKEQVLSKGMILEIANQALRLEEHYQKPQDIEFAIEHEKLYIVQSRPVTTKGKAVEGSLSGNVLLEGLGASPGIGVGNVRLVKTMEDLSKIKKGEVLVTEMTNPDMVVSMQKSVAIITDEGGMTSHAAIVSREMGIPAIVGTSTATETLQEGQRITVDGSSGKVYEGQVAETRMVEVKPAVETKIRLKLIIDLPDFAERAAESKLEYIGLMRLEGIIASMGKHPLQYEREDKLEDYKELLKEGISKISKPFKSIWIRSSDLRSDEYGSLKGAMQEEINPMLGFHGIRFSLKYSKIFEAELQAIKEVAEKNSDKEYGVMFPQIISIDELKKAKEIFNKFKTNNMKVGAMIETPASVEIIDDICNEVDFVSFGTNDLTQYTLAVDRGEDSVQELYDDSHPAVLSQIKRVINACKGKIEVSICGQAGSKEEMVEFLLKQGIDSISVNADAAERISKFVQNLEGKIKQEPKEVEKAREERKQFDKRKQQGMVKKEELKEKPIKADEQGIYRKEEVDKERKDKKKYGKCEECGKDFRLRFRPKPGKPILCRACYKQGQKKHKLPELKSEPIKIQDIEKKQERLEKIQEQQNKVTEPKVEESIKQETQEVIKEQTEHVGPVHAIDDTGRIDEKTEDIKQDVKEQKLKDLEEKHEIEESVKVEGVDEEVGSENLEDIGVYNPNSEEDNNPQAREYKFDDEDEDIYSDVF